MLRHGCRGAAARCSLLLTDPVDAFWTSAPLDFGGKPLKSLSQGDIDFGLIPLLDHNKEETKPEADEAAIIAVIAIALMTTNAVRGSGEPTTSATHSGKPANHSSRMCSA